MGTAIHKNLTPDVSAAFEDLVDPLQLRLLKNDHWIRCCVESRTAGRQAVSFRIVFGFILRVIVVDRRRPGQEGNPGFGSSAAAKAATTACAARGLGMWSGRGSLCTSGGRACRSRCRSAAPSTASSGGTTAI